MKRVVIAIIGGTVLVAGIAMLVLPGPAVLVIPAGLAILAVEFAWARRWLRSARAILSRHARDHSLPKKITVRLVGRSMEFLHRQIRRTLLPKRKAQTIG
jgi:Putative transmembrane protein (PGPGW)